MFHVMPTNRSGGTRSVVIAVVAVIVGGAYLLYGMFTSAENAPESGRDIAEPFLAAIRSGNAASAWDTTTAEFKSNLGRENFLKYVESHPLAKEPLEFYALQAVTINGLPCAECLFGKEGAPGSGPKVRVLLAREHGAWIVERLIADESK